MDYADKTLELIHRLQGFRLSDVETPEGQGKLKILLTDAADALRSMENKLHQIHILSVPTR
jgi:hypothetical protein